MGRGRAVQLIAIAVCAIAIVGVAARYLWLLDQRNDTEQTVVTLVRRTSAALDLLQAVETTRARADTSNAAVQAERDRIRAAAAALHADLSRTRADTTTAEIGAYVSGAQANNLRLCLTGVSQALNQLAVGDGTSVASLRAVDAPCRAVGVL